MIRIGSCGALQRGIHVGIWCLSNGTVRNDGTSRTYIEDGYPAVADFSLLAACKDAVESIRVAISYRDCQNATASIRMKRMRYMHTGRRKALLHPIWNDSSLVCCRQTTWCEMRFHIKCCGCASEDDLQEQINHYTDGENMASQGEKNEILTALEAFVRINKSTTER